MGLSRDFSLHSLTNGKVIYLSHGWFSHRSHRFTRICFDSSHGWSRRVTEEHTVCADDHGGCPTDFTDLHGWFLVVLILRGVTAESAHNLAFFLTTTETTGTTGRTGATGDVTRWHTTGTTGDYLCYYGFQCIFLTTREWFRRLSTK